VPIELKVARTAKELDDVFRLRYDVYVSEREKFSEKRATSDGRMVDSFDDLPGVANVVAYDGDVAIASFRVNKDSVVGLPSEKYFDFTDTRGLIEQSAEEANITPCIVSCSMLAIRKQWRHKRNVIFALFKTVTAVMRGWGATHIFGAASAETFPLYERFGVKAVAEEQWVESVGDRLMPVMGSFGEVFNWAFGKDKSTAKYFLPDNCRAQPETILPSQSEVLSPENDRVEKLCSVERGGISLRPGQKDFVITRLGHEGLFGKPARVTASMRALQ